jgi:hypothetical protein
MPGRKGAGKCKLGQSVLASYLKATVTVLPAPKQMSQLRTFIIVRKVRKLLFVLIGMTCGY